MRWLWQARLPAEEVGNGAVHDGDTIRLELDLGFGQRGLYPLRLQDVYAPELRQPGGTEARDFVLSWLYLRDREGWPFEVETFRTRTGRDLTTLERYVAVVRDGHSGVSLNEEITLWLADHPQWGGGIGKRISPNG